MTTRFVLPMPRFVLHPLTSQLICAPGRTTVTGQKRTYRSRLQTVLVDLPVLHDDDEVFFRILQ